MSIVTDFIDSIKAGAISSMKTHKVLASITIAQAILESSYGQSGLSKKAYNLFGIKAFTNEPFVIMKTAEYNSKGEKYYINAKFRKYNSYAESINDHALFLVQNSRYRNNGFFSAKDYVGQAQALQKAGYATAPDYADQLIKLIKQYNLAKYDVIETEYLKLDGGGYASFLGGSSGINLIIRDFSQNVNRVFAYVDNDKNASWAFDITPANSNYTVLVKNTSKVITTRNGGYSFAKGAYYKITAVGYNKAGKAICTQKIVIQIPTK